MAQLNGREAAAPPRAESPPRDNITRGRRLGIELRSDGQAEDGMPTMAGHFAVFNRWTEIDSWFEGNFMEAIAPGAFRKTIKENRDAIKVTFNHGTDPALGDKVLGSIEAMGEDDTGGFYEVPLFDTSYNRDLIPGLEAGAYGSSFRFKVVREAFDEEPEPSDHNPKGLPERTLKELRLFEFGPVTFPQYIEADAGLRSLTDMFAFQAIERHPDKFRAFLDRQAIITAAGETTTTAAGSAGSITNLTANGAPAQDGAATAHPVPARRTEEPEPAAATTPIIRPFKNREEYLRWISES